MFSSAIITRRSLGLGLVQVADIAPGAQEYNRNTPIWINGGWQMSGVNGGIPNAPYYISPWQTYEQGVDMGNGIAWFPYNFTRRIGTAEVNWDFAQDSNSNIVAVTSPGRTDADAMANFPWIAKNIIQHVNNGGQNGFAVRTDQASNINGSMVQTGRDNGKYAVKSKGFDIMTLVAIGAAVFTGGESLGLWGAASGAAGIGAGAATDLISANAAAAVTAADASIAASGDLIASAMADSVMAGVDLGTGAALATADVSSGLFDLSTSVITNNDALLNAAGNMPLAVSDPSIVTQALNQIVNSPSKALSLFKQLYSATQTPQGQQVYKRNVAPMTFAQAVQSNAAQNGGIPAISISPSVMLGGLMLIGALLTRKK